MTNPVKAFALIALGLAIAAMGIYVANADDAPGAAVIGFLLMLAAVLFGLRTARNRLPARAGRTALAAGVLTAASRHFSPMRSSSSRSAWPRPSIHYRALARRSTSRDLMTIHCVEDG